MGWILQEARSFAWWIQVKWLINKSIGAVTIRDWQIVGLVLEWWCSHIVNVWTEPHVVRFNGFVVKNAIHKNYHHILTHILERDQLVAPNAGVWNMSQHFHIMYISRHTRRTTSPTNMTASQSPTTFLTTGCSKKNMDVLVGFTRGSWKLHDQSTYGLPEASFWAAKKGFRANLWHQLGFLVLKYLVGNMFTIWLIIYMF